MRHLGLTASQHADTGSPSVQLLIQTWPPTRDAALARLAAFTPSMGETYARKRNFDFGPADRSNVSALSPWLRARIIREDEALQAALQHHGIEAAQSFIQEVLWRGYFKGWLEHQPDVWTRYQENLQGCLSQLERDGGAGQRYAEACAGRTGIACFDAWARELTDTGYLHNHARMWFASIWIFTLRLPWELGADFFFRHLLDADPASNTCSWRWVGGLHTPGKTYLARPDNIAAFTGGRFPATDGLANSAPTLTEPPLAAKRPPVFAAADLAGRRYALLVTEEDSQPGTLALPHPPAAVLIAGEPAARSPLGTGRLAFAFTSSALLDAGQRAAEAFETSAVSLPGANWASALADAASALNLDAVVTARLPVGPARSQVRRAWASEALARLPLIEIARPYDVAVWPHTRAGFFKLRQQIPAILDELRLA